MDFDLLEQNYEYFYDGIVLMVNLFSDTKIDEFEYEQKRLHEQRSGGLDGAESY